MFPVRHVPVCVSRLEERDALFLVCHDENEAYPSQRIQHRQRAPGNDEVDQPLRRSSDGDVQRSQAGRWYLGDVDPAARPPAELEEPVPHAISQRTITDGQGQERGKGRVGSGR